MLNDLRSDVRFAFRTMKTHPVFTIVVILTLAVGLGANTAIFSVLHAALFEALPYEDPQRLVMGRTTFKGRINPVGSAHDYFDYREQADVFSSFAAITGFPVDVTITGGASPERLVSSTVSHELFGTLGVDPVAGRHFRPEEGTLGAPDVVIISYGYWQRRFGGAADAIGRPLVVNGIPSTIVGIMPAGFRFLWNVDVWAPMRRNGPWANARRFHNWLMVGRLRPGVSLEQAQGQIDVISARLEAQYPDSNTGKALRLDILQDAIAEDDAPRLLLLMAAVAVVLLITCGNVAGLLLARSSARRAETAVRAALGASRSRLVRQFLTESLVLAGVGGILGAAVAGWLHRSLPMMVGLDTLGVTDVGFNGPVILFAAGVTLLTGLLFGIAPAIHSAAHTPLGGLGSGTRTTGAGSGTRLRGALVVAQVALSLVLLITSGLLVKSFLRLAGTDPGFDADHLLTAQIQLPGRGHPDPAKAVAFFDALSADVRSIPGVTAVAAICQMPIRDPGNNINVWAAERPPAEPSDARWAYTRRVMPGYFETMGIPILAGRDVTQGDVSGAPQVIVINRTMAETLFPGEHAVGRRVMVDMGGDQPEAFEVAGVVGDVRVSSLGSAPRMTMYHSFYQFPNGRMRLALRTAVDPTTITTALRERVWKLNGDIPVEDVISMRAVVAESVASQRVVCAILLVFAVIALLLAAIGLYGVLAYWVVQRTHEIGVRVALGASAWHIVRTIAARGLMLVGTGMVVGLVAAAGSTRWIRLELYQVQVTDLQTHAFTVAVFLLVALAACLLPSWRALRVDPIVALRVE